MPSRSWGASRSCSSACRRNSRPASPQSCSSPRSALAQELALTGKSSCYRISGGVDPKTVPRFVRRYIDGECVLTNALNRYDADVKEPGFQGQRKATRHDRLRRALLVARPAPCPSSGWADARVCPDDGCAARGTPVVGAIATQRPSISQTRKARANGKTSRQSASRGRVVWSGASRSTRIKDRTERRKPSAWRSGNPKTSLSVNAVSIARSENFASALSRSPGAYHFRCLTIAGYFFLARRRSMSVVTSSRRIRTSVSTRPVPRTAPPSRPHPRTPSLQHRTPFSSGGSHRLGCFLLKDEGGKWENITWAAASYRGDLCGSYGRQDGTQPVKPESEQRTQRQMTLRLILPLSCPGWSSFRLGDSSFWGS